MWVGTVGRVVWVSDHPIYGDKLRGLRYSEINVEPLFIAVLNLAMFTFNFMPFTVVDSCTHWEHFDKPLITWNL